MSGEFPHFSSKSRVGDFCSCKLRIMEAHPSLDSDFSDTTQNGPCPLWRKEQTSLAAPLTSVSCQYATSDSYYEMKEAAVASLRFRRSVARSAMKINTTFGQDSPKALRKALDLYVP